MLEPQDSLFQLARLFRERGRLTAQEQADALGLSPRQVRRLREQLIERGLPLQREREGRTTVFVLPEAERVARGPSLTLTERQWLALTVAAQAARAALAPTPLAEPLEHALDALSALAEDVVMTFEPEFAPDQWGHAPVGVSEIDAAVFEGLMRALIDGEEVEVDYLTASTGQTSTGRRLYPLHLALRGSSWLLTAYCFASSEVRDFAVARISRLVQTGRRSPKPVAFDARAHYRERFNALGGDVVHDVRLDVGPDKAPYFTSKTYHPSQQITRRDPDGRLEVTYRVSGLEEIASFLRSWGPSVRAVAPPDLVNRMRVDSQRLAALYEEVQG